MNKNINESLSTVVLLAYIAYGFVYLPGIQYLVSLAVAGLVYGISSSIESTVVALLVSSILFSIVMYKRILFVASQEGFVGKNPQEIANRIRSIRGGGVDFVKGVGSSSVEGFEDANQTDMTLSNPEKKVPDAGATGTSTPAPATGTPPANLAQVQQLMNGLQQMAGTLGTVKPPTAAPPSAPAAPAPAAAPPAAPPAAPSAAAPAPATPQKVQGFQGSETAEPAGLFKLGVVPTDAAGGYHIDAGTTVINALKSLQPDQIRAMTSDTKQLIETQRSLMEMLQTFKPIVNEGRDMMETFSQMFKA